jgi:hypothetical protein
MNDKLNDIYINSSGEITCDDKFIPSLDLSDFAREFHKKQNVCPLPRHFEKAVQGHYKEILTPKAYELYKKYQQVIPLVSHTSLFRFYGRQVGEVSILEMELELCIIGDGQSRIRSAYDYAARYVMDVEVMDRGKYTDISYQPNPERRPANGDLVVMPDDESYTLYRVAAAHQSISVDVALVKVGDEDLKTRKSIEYPVKKLISATLGENHGKPFVQLGLSRNVFEWSNNRIRAEIADAYIELHNKELERYAVSLI